MIINSVTATNSWAAWCYDGNSWHTLVSNVNLGNLNAAKQEVAGEVKRTVSGTMPLPGSGARFKSAQVRNSSGTWESIRPSTSNLSFYGNDHPYDLDFNSNYFDFYVDD